MTPERWQQVEEIAHAALSRGESERTAFLAQRCAGDLALRREVEVLLAQQASGFREVPAVIAPAKIVNDADGSLLTGRHLGAYQVHERIGVGGMGEVYRARDTKLGRDVAIKILPRLFTSDPDRLARFEREARVLASLNHPHIGAIYGLEDADGVPALVLELVPGQTLADRIARGPLPLNETLIMARQIADALEAAHEKGIVHRDLKPANIKITPGGVVKVLDFGLAKAASSDVAPVDLTQSPTITVGGTQEGVILGTAAYMSPEQARGRTADKRADVWAFGVVLYEMLTGRQAFPGETTSEVLAKVIEREPDWSALPAPTPQRLRELLRRCVRKDPKTRLQAIGDARVQIEEWLSGGTEEPAAPSPAANHRERVAWLIATAILLGVALFFAMRPSNSAPSSDPISFAVFPPEGTAFSGSVNTTVNVPSFALSPDGRALVFSAQATGGKPTLWVRAMDSVDSRQLVGTDDAQDPMWSPDNHWIGFFADGKLKKLPAVGGPVQVITQTATDFRAGTWGPDGTILFASGTDAIVSVNAGGSKVTRVTAFDPAHQEKVHRNPHFLPDGQHFLYSIMGHRDDKNGVYVGSLDGRTKKLLLHVNTSAVYVPPGYLLFADGDSLLGQAFDAAALQLVGQPFLVAAHGGRNTAFMSAVSASRTGGIAYAGIISQAGRLEWIDRAGTILAPAGTPDGDYTDFRLSPDETQLASSLFDPKTNAVEIWLTDLARSSRSRLSPGGLITASAVWSPDGTRLTFRTNRNGMIEFYERSAAGGGSDRPVLSAEAYQAAKMPSFNLVPTDWSPTGKQIIFSAPTSASGSDLWVLPIGEGGTPAPFIASRAEQMHGNFSPNGGLVAYTSNESGRFEVYVETIPQSDRKWAVSANGGYEPRWRGDGGEIYYLSQDRKMMSVSVGAGPSFGAPKPLFQTRVPAGVTNNRTHFVPSRDGRRFLVKTALEGPTPAINIIVNWAATINK